MSSAIVKNKLKVNKTTYENLIHIVNLCIQTKIIIKMKTKELPPPPSTPVTVY